MDNRFGDILKQIRLSRGLSQEELGQMLGTSKQVISRYESGQRTPKITVAQKYAEILGVPFNTLIGDDSAILFPSNVEPLPSTRMVPLYSAIACGTPMFADGSAETMVPMPENLKADFAVRCKGDSMTGARILDGDLVFIHRQPTVENGEIAAVLVGDEATLKRFYRYGDTVVLRAENPTFKEMAFTGAELEQIQIMGKAVAFLSGVN